MRATCGRRDVAQPGLCRVHMRCKRALLHMRERTGQLAPPGSCPAALHHTTSHTPRCTPRAQVHMTVGVAGSTLERTLGMRLPPSAVGYFLPLDLRGTLDGPSLDLGALPARLARLGLLKVRSVSSWVAITAASLEPLLVPWHAAPACPLMRVTAAQQNCSLASCTPHGNAGGTGQVVEGGRGGKGAGKGCGQGQRGGGEWGKGTGGGARGRATAGRGGARGAGAGAAGEAGA